MRGRFKTFPSSLLGNEEDAKGLLNIKQEFLSHYLLHRIPVVMWQVVSLEMRRSGNEWLWAMLFPLYNVVQANAFGSRKLQDSGLKVLITFQVWARLFSRSMYFFVFVFSYLLYECVPCHNGRYQTLLTSGS